MALDAATETLRNLDDPTKFKARRRVPIFVAHTETRRKKDGTIETLTWGEDELRTLAYNLNRREKVDGQPVPVAVGHITPGMKEEDIGPTLGVTRNHVVDRFGPKQRLGILADEYYPVDKYDEAMKYPHRSVEIDRRLGEIDRVCLIKRPPKLPLGVVLPDEPPRQVLQFQADGCSLLRYSRGSDEDRLCYQLESIEPEPEGAAAMNDELKAFLDKLSGRLDAIEKRLPSATGNKSGKLAYQAADPNDDDDGAAEKLTYSKEELDAAILEERQKADAARKATEQRLAKLEQEREADRLMYQAERDLDELEADGVMFDREEELATVKAVGKDGWDKHKERMRLRYARRFSDGLIRIADMPTAAKPLTKEQANQAAIRASEKRIDFDAACRELGYKTA